MTNLDLCKKLFINRVTAVKKHYCCLVLGIAFDTDKDMRGKGIHSRATGLISRWF